MSSTAFDVSDNTISPFPEVQTNPGLVPTNEDFASLWQGNGVREPLRLGQSTHLEIPNAFPGMTALDTSLPDPYAGLAKQEIKADTKGDRQSPQDNYNENTIWKNSDGQFTGIAGIQNSDTVIPGLLYRGANPGGCNDATHPWSEQTLLDGLQALKDKGVTVDVSFEAPQQNDPCIAARIAAEKQACAQKGYSVCKYSDGSQHTKPD